MKPLEGRMKKILAFWKNFDCAVCAACLVLAAHGGALAQTASESARPKCGVSGVEKDAPILCGSAEQGGLLYGEAAGWDVYARGEKISLKDVFVVGISYDAADTLKLEFVKTSDGKSKKTYSYLIKRRGYPQQKITVPAKYIQYSKEIEKRINNESAKIKKVRAESAGDTALHFKNLSLPAGMGRYRRSGVYGAARVYNGSVSSWHKGDDYAAPAGTEVKSAGRGVVILAEEHYMNGKIVIVSHGHGVTSHYLHLSNIKVKVGDKVGNDTVIGLVGNTGQSSGAHLHFQINHMQTPIDPKQAAR
jgi:murein DD-endopeptidase MepM/ murein hydrolase activator NlpD